MVKTTASILTLAALFLFTTSCQKTKDKINELVEFDINYTTNQTIPSSSVSASVPIEFITPEMPTNSASAFSQNGTSKELIDEVTLTRFSITNKSGNLDFLKSISVYIKAAGLTDVLIATKTNFPKGVDSVSCDVTKTNVKEHLFKDKIQFRISVTVNNAPATSQLLKLDQTINVKGKLL